MTAAEVLAKGFARLKQAGVADPSRDARKLLAHALDVAPDRLTVVLVDEVPDAAAEIFDAAVSARSQHQPVAQIVGKRAFWTHEFHITRDVLDPRPETETLVAVALEQPAERVLDLGTGSGCILLTLLAEWPDAKGLGTDLSVAALGVARQNASALGVQDRASFQQADWLENLSGQFDLVVSNPPYIAASEMADLSDDVRLWEPQDALSPGGDGLNAYRAILSSIGPLLSPGARLLFEIGPTQADAVLQIGSDQGLRDVRVIRDLDERDRVVQFVQSA